MIINTAAGPVRITVHPSQLAHCRECCQPMYCIYDYQLRAACWECMVATGAVPPRAAEV